MPLNCCHRPYTRVDITQERSNGQVEAAKREREGERGQVRKGVTAADGVERTRQHGTWESALRIRFVPR